MEISKLKTIYEYRELIKVFAITDLKLRYKNSILGFFWSILEPLLMLTVLYLVFSYILRSDVENYPMFLLIGLITWNMFSRGTSMATNSILARSGIILSVPLPKIIFPLSSVVTSFLMMLFELIVFVGFIVVFQFQPPITALILPLSFIPLFIITVGISLGLSSLNVLYRDIGYIWTVIVQAGFFLTPIIYQIDIFPETMQKILMLNPMAHIVTWNQDLTLYGNLPTLESLGYVIATSLVILIIGFLIFKRYENSMVDKL